MPTPLITKEDVYAQPEAIAQLATRLCELPDLDALPPERPWLFVGEGSSFNAVAWMLPLLRNAHPHRRVILRYPWAFLKELEQWPSDSGITPYVIAISQSGRTASLIHAMDEARKKWKDFDGHLITNADDSSLNKDNWSPLTTFFLQVGNEAGIAATKTFTTTALAVLMLGDRESAAILAKMLPTQLPEFVESLRVQSAWSIALNQCVTQCEHPLVLIGHDNVMTILGEAHLKLTETLSRPVLTYHHEGFKHGPKSVLHRDRSVWPQLIYSVPKNDIDAKAFYADAMIHLQHIQLDQATQLNHLWIRPVDAPPIPDALKAKGHFVELVLNKPLPEDWALLTVVQHLALDLVERMNLQTDGLTKFVSTPIV